MLNFKKEFFKNLKELKEFDGNIDLNLQDCKIILNKEIEDIKYKDFEIIKLLHYN